MIEANVLKSPGRFTLDSDGEDNIPKTDVIKYYPKLDSLRTIAIALVIIGHWFPVDHFLRKYWNNGFLGVSLFFVLSGFLIGSILLNEKYKLEENASSAKFWGILKNFYIRRSLRIFPVYYIFIILLLVLNYPAQIGQAFPWFASYTTNFFLCFNKDSGQNHLWTLAVEEQFYLITPFVLLLANRKYLLHTILAFIIIGVASRIVIYEAGYDFYKIMTPCKFDYFGMGILLAYFRINSIEIKHRHWIGLFALIVYIVCSSSLFSFTGKNSLLNIAIPSLPIFFAYLINEATLNGSSFGKLVFENGWMVYIGKISYGIYLIHGLVPELTNYIFNFLNISLLSLYPKILLDALVVLLIAHLSFVIIETPINRLKKYYRS